MKFILFAIVINSHCRTKTFNPVNKLPVNTSAIISMLTCSKGKPNSVNKSVNDATISPVIDITGKKNELIKNVTTTIKTSIRKNLHMTVAPIFFSIVTSSIAQMPATIEKNIIKTVTVIIKLISVDKVGAMIFSAKIL